MEREESPIDAPISKTQRKRESTALQELGKQLTRLTPERLRELHLPERLHDAVMEATRITKFGALRRQLQYIGRLMHEADSGAIAARLESWQGRSRQATAHLHLLERWRTRLLEDETALSELGALHPGCDLQKLAQLLRNVRREKDEGKPPRSYRALFQELRLIIPEP
jgi:ribosome-associated protein